MAPEAPSHAARLSRQHVRAEGLGTYHICMSSNGSVEALRLLRLLKKAIPGLAAPSAHGDTGMAMEQSMAIVVYLSPGCFHAANSLMQIKAALASMRPLVLVYESTMEATLDELRSECPTEARAAIFEEVRRAEPCIATSRGLTCGVPVAPKLRFLPALSALPIPHALSRFLLY